MTHMSLDLVRMTLDTTMLQTAIPAMHTVRSMEVMRMAVAMEQVEEAMVEEAMQEEEAVAIE
jgi:hypothetical protein